MRIGELSRKAGVNLQTIRFYERKGLLREPRRTAAGYRDYSSTDFEQVRFIRECQQLGFTLKEVGQLSRLHWAFARLSQNDLLQSEELQALIGVAQRKLSAIHERIESLQVMHQQLSAAVAGLEHRAAPVCPGARRSPQNA